MPGDEEALRKKVADQEILIEQLLAARNEQHASVPIASKDIVRENGMAAMDDEAFARSLEGGNVSEHDLDSIDEKLARQLQSEFSGDGFQHTSLSIDPDEAYARQLQLELSQSQGLNNEEHSDTHFAAMMQRLEMERGEETIPDQRGGAMVLSDPVQGLVVCINDCSGIHS
jgi:hypothetical protein